MAVLAVPAPAFVKIPSPCVYLLDMRGIVVYSLDMEHNETTERNTMTAAAERQRAAKRDGFADGRENVTFRAGRHPVECRNSYETGFQRGQAERLARETTEGAEMTAAEHRRIVESLTQAEIDHIHDEYRAWAGESEAEAARRDLNAILEEQSRKEPR